MMCCARKQVSSLAQDQKRFANDSCRTHRHRWRYQRFPAARRARLPATARGHPGRPARPGTRLREVELAESLGLSRTVREALSRLESEGTVVNEPNRGMMVTQLDASMVSELYVMREVTGYRGGAGGPPRHRCGAVSAARYRRARRRLPTIPCAAANNRLFHETLHRCAHNRYLLKTLRSLHESMALLGRSLRCRDGHTPRTRSMPPWWRRWNSAIRPWPSRSCAGTSSRPTRSGCRCGSKSRPGAEDGAGRVRRI